MYGNFPTHIIATGIQNILAEREKPTMNDQDIKNIKKLAKEKDLFDILAASIAPSIEGN